MTVRRGGREEPGITAAMWAAVPVRRREGMRVPGARRAGVRAEPL